MNGAVLDFVNKYRHEIFPIISEENFHDMIGLPNMYASFIVTDPENES